MLDELLPEDKRRLSELELQLSLLEDGSNAVNFSDLVIGVTEMSSRMDELEILVNKESKSRRNDMRRRVQHLRNTHSYLKKSLESYGRRTHQNMHELQRKELFGDTPLRDPETVDLEMAENASLARSNIMVNDYLDSGRNTLHELTSQRERLQGVQSKVLQMMHLLGVSKSIMRAVENRDYFDRIIVFVGMFLILVFIFAVYFFFK
mmetsp:Transcript_28429/g.48050  ORF Transcript_28429/g.48050 Transcript_28429/m.48050 type:complete len:206 (+) Transcript_28429:186-803(+)